MKSAYIHTFGCQMNEYDTSRMYGLLGSIGYSVSESPEDADLIIVNTCSVREKPENKVFSLLGRIKKKKNRRGTLIAVGGCVAQQMGVKIFQKAPYVDIVFGTHAVDSLPELVMEAEGGKRDISLLGLESERSIYRSDQYIKENSVKAFTTIMQGCDNFCSYCIVPLVRGREYSRPSASIIEDVRGLAVRGVKEVTLLGQNVNSYGIKNGDISFPRLLEKVSAISGIERIRFITSHPRDFSQELIQSFHHLDKLCPHVHLPAQSGSDRILELMGRGYKVSQYMSIITGLRNVCQEVTFSSDFIVGFPGETRDDFDETLSLIREVRFDSSFSFKYSPRPGTAAALMDGQVDEKVKKEWLMELQSVQNDITMDNYSMLADREVKVLVEGISKKDDNRLTGRTGCNKIVNFVGKGNITGKIVTIKVTGALSHSLTGILTGGG